jgi:hypothetical protein
MRSAERTRIHFFCLSKRNESKKKTPDGLLLAVARGSLRFSARSAGKSEHSEDQAVGCLFFWLLFFAAWQRKVVLVR